MSNDIDKSMSAFITDYFEKHLAKIDELIAKAVAKILKVKLKELEEMLKEREEEVAIAVARILKEKMKEHQKAMDSQMKEREIKLGAMVREQVKELAKPGKDADEDRILNSVLARIVLPDEAKITANVLSKVQKIKELQPDTPLQIKEKLVLLPIRERWFDEGHIKNLEELIKRMISLEPSFGGALRGGMETTKREKLTPTVSGNNITLDLTQLSTSWSRLLGVFKNGQLLDAETVNGWTRSENTITVYNSDATDLFVVDYAS